MIHTLTSPPLQTKLNGVMTFIPYPLLFKPIYKDYVWGGDRIHTAFERVDAPVRCAESWELSAHEAGPSVVSNGALAGRTLAELANRYGAALTGTRAPDPYRFPLLFKLIDAHERLSVQVHPNGENIAHRGDEPKSEMWLVLDCTPDAAIFVGLKPGVGAVCLRQALANATVADCLNKLHVRPGDALYIPGGLVHAIGVGCLIYEVQQSSNTTYRLYDWERLDKNGRPRPLHIEQALKVIDWNLPPPDLVRYAPETQPHGANCWTDVLCSPFFCMRRLHLEIPETLVGNSATFQVLFIRSGTATATSNGVTVDLPCGTSCLIPAAAASCHLEPRGTAELLLSTLSL